MSGADCSEAELSLISDLQQLSAHARDWSEYDTCDKIILRALREVGGYSYLDYVSQGRTVAGVPDYTFLPDTAHMWYLEAKAYGEELTDQHAVQALNYANATGRRWVVVSNGRIWRLYDQHIPGVPADKMVVEVRLENTPEVAAFLHAIGKQSMQSGRVEYYARRQRLKHVMDEQLGNPRSEVIRAIVSKLRSLGLNGVGGEDVVAYFEGKPAKTEGASAPTGPGEQPPEADGYPLDELARRANELATGKKPLSVTFPDGTVREIDQWTKLVVAVIEWFGERLPSSPQPRSEGSKRYIYNDGPNHAQKPMLEPQEVHIANRTLFVEKHASACEHLSALVYLCKCVGEEPSGFRIRLRE